MSVQSESLIAEETATTVVADADAFTHAAKSLRLAYLISRHPSISGTFIRREVMELRALGAQIDVCSVNRAELPKNGLIEQDQVEANNTFYLKPIRPLTVLAAHLRTFARQPIRYLKGLCKALGYSLRDLAGVAKWPFYFAEAVVVGDWMRRRKLNHVHVHFATEVANISLFLPIVFDVDISFTVHGPDEFYKVDFYHLADKIRTARFLFCISQFAQSQLMKVSDPADWRKMHVLRLGVRLDHFQPQLPAAGRARPQLLCVGRLVPSKGQHILLKAARRLRDRGLSFALHLIGDGPDFKSLEAEIALRQLADCVTLHGALNEEGVKTFLEEADIFVLPSFAEGIPVALMEAMATEIPCVSTQIAGIPELIRSGIDGVLVPPSDDAALADALAALIANPDLRRKLGQAGRLRVADKFDAVANVAALHIAFLEQLQTGDR